MSDWFTANKDGLRQIQTRLVERRGFGFVAGELYQNVMDTSATRCIFDIEKVPNKPRIKIRCEDNGPGFKDLTHAWTMYAPSEKKADPTKAGRFNIGEKAVLSFARHASIHTTSGMVCFDEKGRKTYPRRKREEGTVFEAELAGTTDWYEQLLEYMPLILVRSGLTLIVNGEEIPHKTPIHTFEHTLPTEIGDDLRPSRRITKVEIYEHEEDVPPMLYELGIPVVTTEDDKWHYNVCQKVPLNTERDNVTISYMTQVRVAVFNEMYAQIEEEDTVTTWVTEATSDSQCSHIASEAFLLKKYGENAVTMDPTNQESNSEAVSQGYTVIHSRGLTPGQRMNLKSAGVLQSSSAVFPNKRAYSNDPDAPPVKVLSGDEISIGMNRIGEYARELGKRLLGKEVSVRFVWTSNPFSACYGSVSQLCSQLDFNVKDLGRAWFDHGVTEDVDDTLLHEFGHEYEADHLSVRYHKALTKLGAKLKVEVLKDGDWFRKFIN